MAPLRPASSRRAKATFSTVSVVRMAVAASWKWLGSDPERRGKIGQHCGQLFRRQRNADDAGRRRKHLLGAAIESLCRGGTGGARGLEPGRPAAQLALPALMATTRTWPPVALRCCLSMMSGAAITRFDVNAAAALAGASATIRAKSVRPLAFRPALPAAKRNPRGMTS